MPASSRQCRVTGSMSPAAARSAQSLAISSTSSSARSPVAMSSALWAGCRLNPGEHNHVQVREPVEVSLPHRPALYPPGGLLQCLVSISTA